MRLGNLYEDERGYEKNHPEVITDLNDVEHFRKRMVNASYRISQSPKKGLILAVADNQPSVSYP